MAISSISSPSICIGLDFGGGTPGQETVNCYVGLYDGVRVIEITKPLFDVLDPLIVCKREFFRECTNEQFNHHNEI